MEVQTWRDGKTEAIYFEEGVFVDRHVGKSNEPSGTYVRWQPSEEFFTHTEVEIDKVIDLFKTITCLCPGLTIVFNNNENIQTFYSVNGLNDLADEAVKNKELLKNRFILHQSNGKNRIDFVLTYTSNYSSTIVPYVNIGLTEKGPHITQVKTLLTREFNKFFREKKWLKEGQDNLTGEDIGEGLYVVFNLTAPNVAYNAQVKTVVTKIDMSPFNSILAENLQSWFQQNEKDVKIIVDKALAARKAREAAKRARDNARNIKKDKKKQLLNLPTKLVDCWSKNRENCELFVAEGDSAASGLVEGRNAEIHAVFPIRGKIIAALKSKPDKIFATQEVINLIKALGLDLDVKTQKLIYDRKKLRYGKILLAADADPDGCNIKNLLIEMLWWLCPELILNGHVYTTMPPLFRITTKKNQYIFLKDIVELEEYKAQHQGEKYLISRNKGLGEQDSDELAQALLEPATRNVAQIIVSDPEEAYDMLDMLMGPSVPHRREYLLKHEQEANEND